MIKPLPVIALAIAGFGLTGQEAAPPTVFTAAQAAAGRTAYRTTCVKCHAESLIPPAGAKYMGQDIPPLAGADFMTRWGARTTNDLSSRVKVAMGGFPPPGLDETTHLNLTAYILQTNGAKPGEQDLTAATAVVIQKTAAAPKASSDNH